MPPVEEIRRTALALLPEDRASLVHDLIASLDNEIDFMDEEEFMTEIHRRSEEIRSGAVQPRECRAFMEELERELGEGTRQ